MLVSIIVPTYNSELYIKEALDSCLTQGYANIELIISDDKSQDSTASLVSEWLIKYKERFKHVEFHPQQKNLGVRDNTNFLIKKAKGDYVRLLEGDDVLVDASIRKQVEFIKASPEKIDFMFSDLLIFKDDVNDTATVKPASAKFISGTAFEQYCMLLYGQRANGPSVFFKRQTMLDCGGYIGARNCADWPTIINLTKQGVRVVQYPEPLLYYRRHGANISDREKSSWKKINYEMKTLRNDKLMDPELHWKHRLYCCQDLLVAKRAAGEKLIMKEKVKLFVLRKLYRLIK